MFTRECLSTHESNFTIIYTIVDYTEKFLKDSRFFARVRNFLNSASKPNVLKAKWGKTAYKVRVEPVMPEKLIKDNRLSLRNGIREIR